MTIVWLVLVTICGALAMMQTVSLFRGARNWLFRIGLLVLCVLGLYYSLRGLHLIAG